MNTRDKRHLARALTVAWASTQRNRHGAVIAHGSRVLAVGVNARRVDPTQTDEPASKADFHAEISALRALRTTVPYKKLTVYAARVDREGNPMLSKPCKRCMLMLAEFGEVKWTTPEVFN